MVLLINFVESASLAIRRDLWLGHRAPTRKRCASCSGSWKTWGKAPGDEWAAYESEMESATEPVRLGHANVLRARVNSGNLDMGRHLAINTAEVCDIDGRPLNGIFTLGGEDIL